MSKAAVIYWSQSGNTEAMAEAVADGARKAGADTVCVRVDSADASTVSDADGVALGCPAMGSEELEEGEFRPFFDSIAPSLAGKKVALFGSYGWGDGAWMKNWEAECGNYGIALVSEGVIANNAPDADALSACEELGKAIAG